MKTHCDGIWISCIRKNKNKAGEKSSAFGFGECARVMCLPSYNGKMQHCVCEDGRRYAVGRGFISRRRVTGIWNTASVKMGDDTP